MRQSSKLIAAASFVGLLLASNTALASDQSNLVAAATQTAENMKNDPAFSQARDMLRSARGVLIVPSLVKGGFIFGAEGGNGVLLARTDRGWSAPAFYSMSSASFGLQIGLEKAQLVLLLMNDHALRAVQSGDFKFGAGAGVTVANLSGGAAAKTGDVIVWTSATGAYGGLTLDGTVLKPRDEWNQAYYGKPVVVANILAGTVSNPGADPLRTEVASVW